MKRAPFVEIDGAPYAAWWHERFAPGFDPFTGMRFYRRGRANVWVGTADVAGLESVRLDAVGVHLLRIGRRLWKPTSTAIVAFGGTERRNAIDLRRGEAELFLAGADIAIEPADPRRSGLARGFVAARFRGAAIGCAEWHERGVLVSCVPRSRQISEIDL